MQLLILSVFYAMLFRVRGTCMAGVRQFEKKVQAMATVIEEQADELVG